MIEIRKTRTFANWIEQLRDPQAVARVDVRLRRLSLGNPGDAKPVGGGVSELRINYGPGYRVYFIGHGRTIVVLLCGGDKQTQDRDIQNAIEMAKEFRNA